MMLWVFSLSLTLPTIWALCPAEETIHPCYCEFLPGRDAVGVTCGAMDTYEEFGNAVESMRGRKDLYSFTIEFSDFNFIPESAFKGIQFKVLEIKNSVLQALTDSDVAFSGLEDHLEILRMYESTLMSDWDWSILRNFKKLDTLEVEAKLKYIDNGVGLKSADTIKDVNFAINAIAYLGDQAFAEFKNLKMLGLNANEITEMKRSMLPDPALQLGLIELGSNKLEKLPADFFTNMPRLKILGLAHNRILFMDQTVFKPIWHLLERFSIMDNDLRCDCRMSWILEQKFPGYVAGRCSNPQNVRGKNINGLLPKDLFCFIKK